MKNTIIGICVLLSLLCIISDAARAATTEIVPGYSQTPIEGKSGLSVSLYKRAWISGSYKLISQAYGGCNADPLKRNTTQSVVAYMSASADRSTWPVVSKSYIETNLSASNLPDGHVRATRTRDTSAPSGKKWYYHFAKKTVGKSQVVYKAHTVLWHVTGFLGPITPRWLGGKNTKRTFRETTETMQAVWTASSRSGLDTSVIPYAYGKITSYSSNTNGATGIMIAQVEADTTKNPDGTDNRYDSLSTSYRQAELVGTGTPKIFCPVCEEVVISETQHLVTCNTTSYRLGSYRGCGASYWSCDPSDVRKHRTVSCDGDKKYRICTEHYCFEFSRRIPAGDPCAPADDTDDDSASSTTTSPTVSSGGGTVSSGGGGTGTGGSDTRVRCGHGNACSRGGYASSRNAHKTTCPAGHSYYTCSATGNSRHANCRARRSGEVRCGNGSWCRSGGWASSRNAHKVTCAAGHSYWGCNPTQVNRHHNCRRS